jgi:hypothetical protein
MDSEVSERIQVLKAKVGEYGTFFVIESRERSIDSSNV